MVECPTKIETVDDAKQFFRYLYMRDVCFHPDDDFNEYVNHRSGVKSFSAGDCERFNGLMASTFDVCDPYDIGLQVAAEFGLWTPEEEEDND